MTTPLEDELAKALHTLTRLRDIAEPKERRDAWSNARSALAAYKRVRLDEGNPPQVETVPGRRQ